MKKLFILSILATAFFSTQIFAQTEYQTKGSGDSKKKMKSNTTVTPTSTTTTAPAANPQSEKSPEANPQAGQPTGTAPGTTTQGKPSGTTTTKPSGTFNTSTAGQSGKMFDAQGTLKNYIDQGGYIRNPKNRLLGQYVNGEFFTKNRMKAATTKDGVITDKTGKEIARIGQDGKVTDGNRKPMGSILADGTVLNAQGNKIGTAPGIDKYVVALVYFFSLPK
jgi:hypothetical protein